jgi:hypothetical protein
VPQEGVPFDPVVQRLELPSLTEYFWREIERRFAWLHNSWEDLFEMLRECGPNARGCTA